VRAGDEGTITVITGDAAKVQEEAEIASLSSVNHTREK